MARDVMRACEAGLGWDGVGKQEACRRGDPWSYAGDVGGLLRALAMAGVRRLNRQVIWCMSDHRSIAEDNLGRDIHMAADQQADVDAGRHGDSHGANRRPIRSVGGTVGGEGVAGANQTPPVGNGHT